ncbi:MAG: AAA family ATPase [Planctomycetia bacterium]|nr:AAA family ATPase [Planctomycetia bacterium]
MELAKLIDGLSRATAYSHPVASVAVCQTHISVVFLAGNFAYKIKKPVQFPFADFSTLEKRRFYCEEEVRLNRRLAPDVYLGVVPVTLTDGAPTFADDGEPVEWAVRMQRLPAEATLHERLRHGGVSVELVETLAQRIAAFHRVAPADPQRAALGNFAAVAQNIRDIYRQAGPHVGQTLSQAVYDQLQALHEAALTRWQPVIEGRAARGVPRDCHGDLHLDHIYHFPDRPPPGDLVVVDCIEFNERFRFIDPVADLAFAVMDFAFHARADLADVLTEGYFRATGDDEGRALLPSYAAYRAAVRGTVEGLKLAEPEMPAADRGATLRDARAHWLLALRLLEAPHRGPCLLLVGGLPGTGKSTLAQGLAAEAGFTPLRCDVVRKELADLPETQFTPPELRDKLYSPAMTDRTYAETLRRAEALLFAGQRVLVDGTFREEHRRKTFLEAAQRWGVPTLLLLTSARSETVKQRIDQRRGDASDADWSIHQLLAQGWEPPGAASLPHVRTIPTDGSREEALRHALQELNQSGL